MDRNAINRRIRLSFVAFMLALILTLTFPSVLQAQLYSFPKQDLVDLTLKTSPRLRRKTAAFQN